LVITLLFGSIKSDIITASLQHTENTNNDDKSVLVTISNPADQPLYLLKWNTPFDDLHGNYLSIKKSNIQSPYYGSFVRRSNPTIQSYETLSPKETRSLKIKINKNYPVREDGFYHVQLQFYLSDYAYNRSVIPRTKNHFVKSSLIVSNVLEIQLFKSAHHPSLNHTESRKRSPTTYNTGRSYVTSNCDSNQISIIKTMWGVFINMLHNSNYEISRGSTNNYRTWFGTYTYTRYDRVNKLFLAELNILNYYDTVNFDCKTCLSYPGYSDAFAYTYPYDTDRHIYLCPVFWTSPVGGNNQIETQAGTIVHELTHFNALGNPGTIDIVYGENDCLNLAYYSPDKAIQNADNYAIFSERMFNY